MESKRWTNIMFTENPSDSLLFMHEDFLFPSDFQTVVVCTSNMSSLAFIFFILEAPTAADRALSTVFLVTSAKKVSQDNELNFNN